MRYYALIPHQVAAQLALDRVEPERLVEALHQSVHLVPAGQTRLILQVVGLRAPDALPALAALLAVLNQLIALHACPLHREV